MTEKAATKEQIAFVQTWLITGDAGLEAEAREYLPALITRIEEEQAKINAWIQTARSAGVTICNRDLEIEEQQATIERLEERVGGLKGSVETWKEAFDRQSKRLDKQEATIERLEGKLERARLWANDKHMPPMERLALVRGALNRAALETEVDRLVPVVGLHSKGTMWWCNVPEAELWLHDTVRVELINDWPESDDE